MTVILRLRVLVLVFTACCIASCGPHHKASVPYDVVDLGTLGGDFSRAEGINDRDTVVGQAAIPGVAHYVHAFLWHDGHMTDLNTFPSADGEVYPGTDGIAHSINNRGDVVGSIDLFPDELYGQDSRARLWRDGKRFRLAPDDEPLLGMDSGEAYAINDQESILGNAILHEEGPTGHLYKARCFLYERGTIKAIDYLSDSFGINNRGDQCGCVIRGSHAHFILRRGRHEQDFGSVWQLGFNLLRGIVINDKDEIAGTATDYMEADPSDRGSISPRAFLWHKGRWSRLNGLPGYQDCIVGGINNSGQVVGEVRAESGGRQEFPPRGRAAFWDAGKVYDLNRLIPADSGWVLLGATAINNRGSIVGYGKIGGETHGFLLLRCKAKFN